MKADVNLGIWIEISQAHYYEPKWCSVLPMVIGINITVKSSTFYIFQLQVATLKREKNVPFFFSKKFHELLSVCYGDGKFWIRARDKPSKNEVTHPLSSSHTHPHKHPCAPIVVIWETDPLWMKNDFTVLWNVCWAFQIFLSVCDLTTVVCTKIQLAPFISKLLRQSNWQNKDGRHLKSFPFQHPESPTCGTKRQGLSQKTV